MLLGAARERLAGWRAPGPAPVHLPEPEERAVYRILTFALRAGAVLLSAGAGTVDVERTILALTAACGLPGCEADVTFTSLTASYRRGDDVEPVTTLVVVRDRTVNFAKLAALAELRRDLVQGRIDPETAMARLGAIERLSVRRGRVVVLGWAGMAAAFTVLLGGQALAAAVGFVSTGVVFVVNRRLARAGVPDFFLSVSGAAVATAFAVALAALHAPAVPAFVVAGGIMVLVPGFKLVASAQDALTGFPISGTARGLEVLLIATGIATGVSMVIYAGRSAGMSLHLGSIPEFSLLYFPVQVLAAAVAAALYGVATSVPRRFLLWSASTGALGWAIFLALGRSGVSLVVASAVAAIAVGLASQLLAGWHGTHPFLFVVPGIMPLVPGLTIYHGMLSLVEGQRDAAGILVEALAIGLAIAAGVTLGSLLVQPLERPRPN